MERALFYLFGSLAVVFAILMVTRRNPMTSALSLVITFVALAGLYAVLDAHLLFVVQIWVYAGAIMVLVIFVIMLLNLREEVERVKSIGYGRLIMGSVVASLAGWKILPMLAQVEGAKPQVTEDFGSVAAVGELLFTRYLLQFELIGVLLLAVTVAVMVLAKRRSKATKVGG